MLTIWLAWVSSERVCLPCGWHGYSARERVRLAFGLWFGWHGFSAERVSGCANHVTGMHTVSYSAERVPVSDCACHLAGMDTVLSGCL